MTGTQSQRLTDPLVYRYGGMIPTSWDDALWLAAEITRRVVEEQGEDGLIVSAFDHGGAGGGYENTWATGKLYFESMKVKNIRIHNRPAYNSEVHATRDMGVGELNNCYEDAELADTIVAVGHERARDADELFPQSLAAEHARDHGWIKSASSSRTSRMTSVRVDHHRPAAYGHGQCLRRSRPERRTSSTSRSIPAPI